LVGLYERKLAHPLFDASFMPHEFSGRDNMWREVADWKAACDSCGLHYIDARSPVDRVINEIAASKLLVTEALHGAIVATALMIPWIPVRFYSHINCFKWRDWLATVGLEYQPVTIPLLDSSFGSQRFSFNRLLNANRRLRAHLSSHLAARAAKKNNPVLVPENHVEALTTRLLDKVAELRREYF
jgi:succinoglycan biosynthesis protein ExoV